jgi:hypothetical protein
VNAVPTAGGYGVIFTSAGGARFVFPDAGSPAGWTQESLPAELSPTLITGIEGADGVVSAVAIGPDQSNPDVQISTRTAAGTWSAWLPVPVGAGVPGEPVVGLVSARAGGTAEPVVTLQDGSGWRLDPALGAGGWQSIGQVTAGLVTGAVVDGTAGVVTVVQADLAYDLVFYPRPYGTSALTLATGCAVTALTAAEQADGNSLLFTADNGYISGAPRVSMLDCAHRGDRLQVIDAGRTIVSEMVALPSSATAPVTLFATDTGHRRLRTWRAGLSDPDHGMFDLGIPMSSLSAAVGTEGQPELVGVDGPARRLHRLWQTPAVDEPPDDAGQWQSSDIELPAGRLEMRYAHSTLFTLTSADGVPLSDAPVDVYADQVVGLEAGGVSGMAGPHVPLVTTTDAAGRVRVSVPTERFTTCKLVVLPAGTPRAALPEVTGWYAPNARAMRRLRTITAGELAPLVPDPGKRAAVQESLNKIATADFSDLPSPQAAGVYEAWQLTVDADGMRFRTLTEDELAERLALGRPQVSVGGLLDFLDDAFEAIAEAVETAADCTVSVVGKVLSMAIDLVIDGVHWAISAAVQTVEEGVAAVQAVLTLAGTAFDRIVGFFGWLLSEARADIWRTKKQLEALLVDGLTELSGYAGQAQALSDRFFADLTATTRGQWDELLAAVGGERLSGGGTQGRLTANPVQEVIDEFGSLASWMFDKLLAGDGGFVAAVTVPSGLPEKMERFAGSVTNQVYDQLKSRLDEFGDAFARHASSARRLDDLALSIVLELAKEAVLAALGVTDVFAHEGLGLIHDVLTGLTTVLATPVGPGLAQDLADEMNPGDPESLSMAGLAALVAAVPVTVLYKAITGNVPFPRHDAELRSALDDDPFPAISGVLMILPWSIVDTTLDVIAAQPEDSRKVLAFPPALNVLFGSLPVIAQLLMFPGRFKAPPDVSTTAAKVNVAAWACGAAPPLFNMLVSAGHGFTAGARKKPWVYGFSLLGWVALAMNITNLVMKERGSGAGPADYISGIAAPLPVALKPLAGLSPMSSAALFVTDAVCDFVAGMARISQSDPKGTRS